MGWPVATAVGVYFARAAVPVASSLPVPVPVVKSSSGRAVFGFLGFPRGTLTMTGRCHVECRKESFLVQD